MTETNDVFPASVSNTNNVITLPLASDMIRGADAIAEWMGLNRRQIYHLASTSRLPVFKTGSILCARKSRLMAWIEAQENRNTEAA